VAGRGAKRQTARSAESHAAYGRRGWRLGACEGTAARRGSEAGAVECGDAAAIRRCGEAEGAEECHKHGGMVKGAERRCRRVRWAGASGWLGFGKSGASGYIAGGGFWSVMGPPGWKPATNKENGDVIGGVTERDLSSSGRVDDDEGRVE